MGAGEYISVSSQADTESADLERERKELATDSDHEHAELAAIYVSRGLDPDLAKQVVEQLTAKDALRAHARDELGISDTLSARSVQAAFASAGKDERARQELASHEAGIHTHEAEIVAHEKEIADHENAGNAPSSTHQHAEADHAKSKQEHETTKAHHKKIMEALRALYAALK